MNLDSFGFYFCFFFYGYETFWGSCFRTAKTYTERMIEVHTRSRNEDVFNVERLVS